MQYSSRRFPYNCRPRLQTPPEHKSRRFLSPSQALRDIKATVRASDIASDGAQLQKIHCQSYVKKPHMAMGENKLYVGVFSKLF